MHKVHAFTVSDVRPLITAAAGAAIFHCPLREGTFAELLKNSEYPAYVSKIMEPFERAILQPRIPQLLQELQKLHPICEPLPRDNRTLVANWEASLYPGAPVRDMWRHMRSTYIEDTDCEGGSVVGCCDDDVNCPRNAANAYDDDSQGDRPCSLPSLTCLTKTLRAEARKALGMMLSVQAAQNLGFARLARLHHVEQRVYVMSR
jgi:hypothetical protein